MRAYTSGQPSPYQQERNRAERERRRAIANRCHGRRKSTDKNPLPHVYKDVGGDVMGCKHCPRVRQLTNDEYRAKYGVDRPAPRQQPSDDGALFTCMVLAAVAVVMVLLLLLAHTSGHSVTPGKASSQVTTVSS